MTRFSQLAVASIIAVAASLAPAQNFPIKPIRLVLPFAPGGSTDALARIIAPRLTELLGQPVIIDNRPGAGGNVSAEIVARATADGHTLLMASAMLTTNKSLYSKLSYDPERDFAPVSHLGGGPYVLVAHPQLPAKNVAELITLAKAKPLHYASSGIGGASHLAGELLKLQTGVAMTHVPYKGGGPAALAVLAGETPILFGTIASSIGHLKAARLKALAVSGLQRSTFLPEVPTVDESGVKGFNVTTWDSFVVPVATPRAVVVRLSADTVRVIRTPEVSAAIRNIGYEPTGSTPDELASFLRAETQLWSKVIKAANIRVD